MNPIVPLLSVVGAINSLILFKVTKCVEKQRTFIR
jgi:hypothetical protein